MTLEQAVKHFGSQIAIRRALKLRSTGAVPYWKRTGKIPPYRQLQIEKLTGGKLKADRNALTV